MSAKPEYSANQPVTIALNGVSDGADISSDELNNSVNLFLMDDLEINLQGGNAGETGSVTIYMLRGNATGELATAVRKVIRVDDIPKFYKLRAVYSSSGAYALGASGNSMAFLGVNIQDA